MLVFDYLIRLYSQDVSVGVAPAVEWRGSAEDSAWLGSGGGESVGAGSAGADWARSMNDKVADVMADRCNGCWWGQWRSLTLGHESEYEIIRGLWSSFPAKDVANPAGIRWVDRKWKRWTLQKLCSSVVQYLEELKQKGKKLAMMIISLAWRSYKSKLVKIWRNQGTLCDTYKDLSEDWMRFIEKWESENFAMSSEYMQWLWSQNELDHHLDNTGYAEQ
jgi:hypothetical protein